MIIFGAESNDLSRIPSGKSAHVLDSRTYEAQLLLRLLMFRDRRLVTSTHGGTHAQRIRSEKEGSRRQE